MLENRIENCLYGVFYGDAIGATVEKLTYKQIYEKYGRVESLDIDYHKSNLKIVHLPRKNRGGGIVTDDSLMTMCLIDVYNRVNDHIDVYNMNKEFVEEVCFIPRYIPEFGCEGFLMDRLFVPEKYIFLRHTLANADPRTSGYGNMVNCGAMMYCAPIGIANFGNPKKAYDEAILFCQGHQYSYGLEAAAVFSAVLAAAFEKDATPESLMKLAIEYAKDGTKMGLIAIKECIDSNRDEELDIKQYYELMHTAIFPYSPMGDDVDRKIEKVGVPSNHYTASRLLSIEELPIAMGLIYLKGNKFNEVILDGINSGRDTDSIGVAIGAILGAMNSEKVYDEVILRRLEEVNKFDFQSYVNKMVNVTKNLAQMDEQEFLKIKKAREEVY